MKKKFYVWTSVLVLLAACSKGGDEPEIPGGNEDPSEEPSKAMLELSKTLFDKTSGNGATLQVNITCNGTWNVTSGNSWCVPDKKSGTGNGVLKLTLSPYIGTSTRTTNVKVTSNELTRNIKVSQDGTVDYHYQIPIIFHVFYDGKSGEEPFTKQRAVDLIAAVNELYRNVNLEFVLATQNAGGQTLTEPGIDRISVTSATMSYSTFMKDKNNLKYLWDLDKYINIMLYNFTENGVAGVAHLPYTVSPDQLGGLNKLNSNPTTANLTYPHCMSINKEFINAERSIYRQSYVSGDPIGTIAHELGHYLGLHHSFNENGNSINTDVDSDYCTDTPPYNRHKYENFMESYIQKNGFSLATIPVLLERTNSVNNTVTTPNNIMDYDVVYPLNFTPQQGDRMRYVLMHSPLIPGPKQARTNTRAYFGEEFPVQMAICK